MADTTTKLSIIIDAQNKADATFKQINDQMKSTSDRMQNIADVSKKVAAVGAVAFAAISGVIYTTVKAATEAQAKMAQFNATLDTMGKKGMQAKDALLDASKAAIKLGFDDEDTANSLAKLYQRTGDVTDAIKLNSLAMDLARAKNIDLESASKLVTLALSGSGRALLQYGIIIKDSATPLEALSILQEKVGGQANAFADTFAGKMAIMKVETDNLKESIGNSLLPVLTDLLKKIEPVITKVTEWIEKNPKLTEGLLLGGLALTGIITALGTIGFVLPSIIAGVSGVGAAFGLLAGPVGIVIGLLAVISTSIFFMVKNWKGAMEELSILWSNFKDGFNKGIEIMMKALQPLVDLFNMIVDGWKGIFGVLGKIGGVIGSVVGGGINKISSALGVSPTASSTSSGFISPLAPKTAGTSYQFNFNGDVNDKDALIKTISDMFNRSASLAQIGIKP